MKFSAFLSHSSTDKQFVMAVARSLGRARATVDKWNFEAGDEFLASIKHYVADSGMFVLFASANSKRSIWVTFEAKLAELLTATIPDRQVLVLLIGNAISVADLPDWLQTYKAVPALNPNEAASYINRHLARLVREDMAHGFVGRSAEYNQLEGYVAARDAPRIFSLSGPTGIGRQSIAEELARRILDLKDEVVIEVEEADGLVETVAKLAPHGAMITSEDSLAQLISAIKSANEEELRLRFLTYCKRIHDSQRLVVLRDLGGLVSPTGELNPQLRVSIEQLAEKQTGYCALITRRTLRDPQISINVPFLRVDKMSDEDMRRLMNTLMKRMDLPPLEVLYLDDLLQYLNGFPPVAYLAAQQIKDYGPAILARDRRVLTTFQANAFVAQLLRDNLLTATRKAILSTLLSYSPLPLDILEEASGIHDVSADLKYLMDYGFVGLDVSGYYFLAPPLTAAVAFQIGYGMANHRAIAERLEEYLKKYSDYEKPLELHRSLFRALAYSGSPTSNPLVIELTSDIYRLQQRLYHARKYEKSVGYGLLVLEKQPNNLRSLNLLVRAYLQMYDFDHARARLDELRARGRAVDVAYLEGFANRKDGKQEAAIRDYKKAIALGRDDVTVYRETAFSYFVLNQLEEADHYLAIARQRDSNNRYVLDLAVQIALRRGDLVDARARLADLSLMDRSDHLAHRRSDVAYFAGDYRIAHDEAKASCELAGDEIPLAFKAQVIKCEIQLGMLDDAESHLDELDKEYPNLHHDVKSRLRIKYLLSRGRTEEALKTADKLSDKSNVLNIAARHTILVALLEAADIDDPRRAIYRNQLDSLNVEPSVLKLE